MATLFSAPLQRAWDAVGDERCQCRHLVAYVSQLPVSFANEEAWMQNESTPLLPNVRPWLPCYRHPWPLNGSTWRISQTYKPFLGLLGEDPPRTAPPWRGAMVKTLPKLHPPCWGHLVETLITLQPLCWANW